MNRKRAAREAGSHFPAASEWARNQANPLCVFSGLSQRTPRFKILLKLQTKRRQNGMISMDLLVPSKGLEPPHRCRYMDLNHARLPIPPRWQVDFNFTAARTPPPQEDLHPYSTDARRSVKPPAVSNHHRVWWALVPEGVFLKRSDCLAKRSSRGIEGFRVGVRTTDARKHSPCAS